VILTQVVGNSENPGRKFGSSPESVGEYD